MPSVSQMGHGRNVSPVNSAAVSMLLRNSTAIYLASMHHPSILPAIQPSSHQPTLLSAASQPTFHSSIHLSCLLVFSIYFMIYLSVPGIGFGHRIFGCGMLDLRISREVPPNHSSVNPILLAFLSSTNLSIHPSTQPFTYPSYLIIFANWNMLDLCHALG